jgi:hypothetical protein
MPRVKRPEAHEAIARRVRIHGIGLENAGAAGPRVFGRSLQQPAGQAAPTMVAPDEEAGHRPDAGLGLVLVGSQACEALPWADGALCGGLVRDVADEADRRFSLHPLAQREFALLWAGR